MRLNPETRLDVRCPAAAWNNTTTTADRAIDIAYDLNEEYDAPVDLYYNSTGILYMTVDQLAQTSC